MKKISELLLQRFLFVVMAVALSIPTVVRAIDKTSAIEFVGTDVSDEDIAIKIYQGGSTVCSRVFKECTLLRRSCQDVTVALIDENLRQVGTCAYDCTGYTDENGNCECHLDTSNESNHPDCPM